MYCIIYVCAKGIFPNNVNVTSNINSTWKDNRESWNKYSNVFYLLYPCITFIFTYYRKWSELSYQKYNTTIEQKIKNNLIINI